MLRHFLAGIAFGLGRVAVGADITSPPQRVGWQYFELLDTLWMYGGQILNYDGSLNNTQAPVFYSFNTSLSFAAPPDPGPTLQTHAQPNDAPLVAHGYTWSNLVDTAWLFGGKASDGESLVLPNDVWRVTQTDSGSESSNQREAEWKQISSLNGTRSRPYRGAGCNVPDLKRGYYLGGMAGAKREASESEYLHVLHRFDFETETLSFTPVPENVPVVNQTLVFLNTATRSGALVVMGGYTEKEGVLSLAPLTAVFIYDLESGSWIEQVTTSANGSTKPDFVQSDPKGNLTGTVLPRMRMSACAAVGSSQDKTSHNIFLLGGQSEQTALLEVWALNLPSAIWVPVSMLDVVFTPRAENSCILLSSHLVMMFGGCLFVSTNHEPCMSFLDTVYNYDLRTLMPNTYPGSGPGNSQGFQVPTMISDIVGGNISGAQTWTKPQFTEFNTSDSSLLGTLFSSPPGYWLSDPFSYQQRISLPLFSCLFISFLPCIGLIAYRMLLKPHLRRIWQVLIMLHWRIIFHRFVGRKTKQERFLQIPLQDLDGSSAAAAAVKPWRPWAFSATYLITLNMATASLLALTLILRGTSNLSDEIFEHWSGGPEADGIWTGERFQSHFIRPATYDRPKGGLLTVYYNAETSGLFNQQNATQRLSRPAYFAITFLCPLITIIYGRLWKTLDDEVKRLDPYYRMHKSNNGNGVAGERSICLNYHSFWAPLSIIQACRYGHWTVMLSSVGSVTGNILVPVLANYVIYWELYSGAVTSWGAEYSWLVALVDPYWSTVLAAVLSVPLLCSFLLLTWLPWQDLGLVHDIRGIAEVLSLMPLEENGFDDMSANWNLTSSQLTNVYQKRLFRLERADQGSKVKLRAVRNATTTSSQPPWSPVTSLLNSRVTKPLSAIWDVLRKPYLMIKDHPNFVVLHPWLFAVWIICLFVLMGMLAWIAASLNALAKDAIWDDRIPFPANMYLLVGILLQSVIDVIDHAVRCLDPYHALSHRYQRPNVLWADYNSGIPLWEILVAFGHGHYLVCSSMLASLAVTIATIFLGSLQLSASAYGSTTFESDMSSSQAVVILLGFTIAVQLGIGASLIWHREWPAVWPSGWKDKLNMAWYLACATSTTGNRGAVLPRPPSSLVDVMPYLLFSSGLQEDLEELNVRYADFTQRQKIKILQHEQHDRRYGLGFIEVDANMLRDTAHGAQAQQTSVNKIRILAVERHFDSPSLL